MNKENSVDTLIAGGGIAGLTLAWMLHKKGQKVRLLDAGSPPPASAVAAGVLNPVTGRNITLGEKMDIYLPAARRFYQWMQKETGLSFFQDVTIRRFFLSEREEEQYNGRLRDSAYQVFLGPRIPPGSESCGLRDDLGSFRIHGAGWVDLPLFLKAVQIRLKTMGVWIGRTLDARQIKIVPNGVQYQEIKAQRIVFCEGANVLTNPWFSWLPFRPVRGETVRIRTDAPLTTKEILHHQKWILPHPQGGYLIGSTYRKGGFPPEGSGSSQLPPVSIDSKAVEEMIRVVDNFLTDSKITQIDGAQSGIRPCSRDRVPYLGPHPKENRIYIFNGLGSKGTLLAPLLAQQLANHLSEGQQLSRETDPIRMVARGFPPTP